MKSSLALKVGLGTLSLLGAGNLYFIKGLVDEVKTTSSAVLTQGEALKAQGEKLNQMTAITKDISDLKADVAVLKDRQERKN